MCRGEKIMSHFYNSEIEYMKTYTYYLKVRTYYALPSNPPYLYKTANVTWLGPPSGILIDFDEIYSIQSILTF